MLTLLCKSAHSPPPQGSAHILKSLLQSQTDVGLDAGPLLPLPPEHLAEGRVRVGGAHGGVRWGGLCGAGEERRLREGKAAGAGSVSLDLRSHDPSPAGPQRPAPAPTAAGEQEQPENPASPHCSGQRSSTPPTTVPPVFAVMVQGHPDISGTCGCEWVRAGLQVALTGLSFTRRPGCES